MKRINAGRAETNRRGLATSSASSLAALNPKRPLALAAAARDAADHVLAPVGGDQRGELPARPLGLLEVARGHQAIGDAGRLVGPDHSALHDGQLERMAPAAAVGII